MYLGAHARPATLADDLRCRNALSGLGKCHPHRARAAAAAVLASTAVADTELERGRPSPSSSSSPSPTSPSRAAGFQNGGHPQTRAFRFPTPEAGPAAEGAPTAAANAAEEPAATDHERAAAAPPPSPATAVSGMSHGRKVEEEIRMIE